MKTRAIMRYIDSGNIIMDSLFDYTSDEKLGEEIGQMVSDMRGQNYPPKNVEIVIRLLEEFPAPLKTNLKEELPPTIVSIIRDGYTSASRDECPYDRDHSRNEAIARVMWLRGFAFKENGKTLDDALSVEN